MKYTDDIHILIAASKAKADALKRDVFQHMEDNITTVEDGGAALQALDPTYYQVFMVDMDIKDAASPDMDGIEVIRCANEKARNTNLVIFATSVKDAITAAKARIAGAAEVVDKVCTFDELINRILFPSPLAAAC